MMRRADLTLLLVSIMIQQQLFVWTTSQSAAASWCNIRAKKGETGRRQRAEENSFSSDLMIHSELPLLTSFQIASGWWNCEQRWLDVGLDQMKRMFLESPLHPLFRSSSILLLQIVFFISFSCMNYYIKRKEEEPNNQQHDDDVDDDADPILASSSSFDYYLSQSHDHHHHRRL